MILAIIRGFEGLGHYFSVRPHDGLLPEIQKSRTPPFEPKPSHLAGYIFHYTLIFLEPDKYLVHQRHLPGGVAVQTWQRLTPNKCQVVKRDSIGLTRWLMASSLTTVWITLVRIPVKLNSDSGICEHHFRKVCGQGFFRAEAEL